MVRAILRDASVNLTEVLSWLKREELKSLCEMFGLDVRGREKEGFAQRIVEHVGAHVPERDDEPTDGDEGEVHDPEPVPRTTGKRQPAVRSTAQDDPVDVFIVHGHDDAMRHEIRRFLEQLGLSAVVLQDLPNEGLTVLEKLERHAKRSKFAIVLLSPDDRGHSKRDGADKAKDRARQNVVLELGLMYGLLGRSQVAVLIQGDLEEPSDIRGLVYIAYDPKHAEAAQWKLARELKRAGFSIDLNRIS